MTNLLNIELEKLQNYYGDIDPTQNRIALKALQDAEDVLFVEVIRDKLLFDIETNNLTLANRVILEKAVLVLAGWFLDNGYFEKGSASASFGGKSISASFTDDDKVAPTFFKLLESTPYYTSFDRLEYRHKGTEEIVSEITTNNVFTLGAEESVSGLAKTQREVNFDSTNNIKNNTTNISLKANQEDLNATNQNVETNKENIETNKTQINTNKNNISTLSNVINNLDKKYLANTNTGIIAEGQETPITLITLDNTYTDITIDEPNGTLTFASPKTNQTLFIRLYTNSNSIFGQNITLRFYDTTNNQQVGDEYTITINGNGVAEFLDQVNLSANIAYQARIFIPLSFGTLNINKGFVDLQGAEGEVAGASKSSQIIDDKTDKPTLGINPNLLKIDEKLDKTNDTGATINTLNYDVAGFTDWRQTASDGSFSKFYWGNDFMELYYYDENGDVVDKDPKRPNQLAQVWYIDKFFDRKTLFIKENNTSTTITLNDSFKNYRQISFRIYNLNQEQNIVYSVVDTTILQLGFQVADVIFSTPITLQNRAGQNYFYIKEVIGIGKK